MAVQIQLRRDSAADWTTANPTLAQGEIGHETDTNKIKIGDGSTAWTSLAYFKSGLGTATASGTDTYAATITGVISYTTHDVYEIIFTNANTGSSTININSLGAKTLKKSVSTNLAAADISSGQSFLIVYDGTNFQVIGLSGSGGAGHVIEQKDGSDMTARAGLLFEDNKLTDDAGNNTTRVKTSTKTRLSFITSNYLNTR